MRLLWRVCAHSWYIPRVLESGAVSRAVTMLQLHCECREVVVPTLALLLWLSRSLPGASAVWLGLSSPGGVAALDAILSHFVEAGGPPTGSYANVVVTQFVTALRLLR